MLTKHFEHKLMPTDFSVCIKELHLIVCVALLCFVEYTAHSPQKISHGKMKMERRNTTVTLKRNFGVDIRLYISGIVK